jgi:pimeloyl-ACP methyl ester carboxylesterase
MGRRWGRGSLGVAAVGAVLLAAVGCRPPTPPPAGSNVPIIFVHGFMGSESQYRSQALRFASNGFPAERVRAFHYNTAAVNAGGLDAYVDAVRREFNTDRVNLVGHSLGTGVVTSYVSTHAAKVARFVLVDGVGCPAGNTGCLAIRAAALGQTHVESSVSAESFDQQYRFFMGRAPATTAITPEAAAQVDISGTALDLQTNAASAAGRTAQVWSVDAATGARTGGAPAATFTIGADGRWGPVKVDRGRPYEISASGEGGLSVHFYFQPFARSDRMVHLTTAPPNSAQATNTNRGPGHSALVVQRQRELWRSHGAANDSLTVSVNGGDATDVLRPVPGDVVAVHLHDDKATPGVSSLRLLPWFSTQPFQSGVDVHLPASSPPTGSIAVVNIPRGDTTKPQRVAVPNWPSSTDAVVIELDDAKP